MINEILDIIIPLYFGAFIGCFVVPVVFFYIDTDYAINYFFKDGYNKRGW